MSQISFSPRMALRQIDTSLRGKELRKHRWRGDPKGMVRQALRAMALMAGSHDVLTSMRMGRNRRRRFVCNSADVSRVLSFLSHHANDGFGGFGFKAMGVILRTERRWSGCIRHYGDDAVLVMSLKMWMRWKRVAHEIAEKIAAGADAEGLPGNTGGGPS